MTVAGVARLAGVSAPTVSRVINGQSGVAVGTRQRVEAIIHEHGYRRTANGHRVAILEPVFHALESPWALEIIRGVEEIARQHQLAVVLTEMEGRLTPGQANSGSAPDDVTFNTYNADGQHASQTTGYGTSASCTTSYRT